MKLSTSWTCPRCGQRVPVPLEAMSGVDGGTRIKLRIRIPDSALADAFAHAWTHLDGDDE